MGGLQLKSRDERGGPWGRSLHQSDDDTGEVAGNVEDAQFPADCYPNAALAKDCKPKIALSFATLVISRAL
jgi:hypothetical protein